MLKRFIRTDVSSSTLALLLFLLSALVQHLDSLNFLSELNSKGQNAFTIVNDWHFFIIIIISIAASNYTTFGVKSTHKFGSIHTS